MTAAKDRNGAQSNTGHKVLKSSVGTTFMNRVGARRMYRNMYFGGDSTLRSTSVG